MSMASHHDESEGGEDEEDTSRFYERPRGRPRKELETASVKTKRRRINEDFTVPPSPKDGGFQGPSAGWSPSRSPLGDSTKGEDACARDCIGDLPNYVIGEEDLLPDLSEVNLGEGAGQESADNFEKPSDCGSVKAQDDEVSFTGHHQMDDSSPQRDGSDFDTNNIWFDINDLGPLHCECDMCIACTCVNCDECVHKDDGNCSHCFSCLYDFDGEISDGDIDDCEPGSSSESEDEPVLSEKDAFNDAMRADLINVCLRNNLSHVAIDDILGFLTKYNIGKFPKSAKTLLKTSGQVNLRDVSPGQYWHNGITKHLIQYASSNPGVSIINVTISSDGVPLFNSSNVAFWPLTCSFNDDEEVYVVGLYLGEKKPDDPNDYIKDFVEEIRPLCLEGLLVKGKVVSVVVEKAIFDAVARSWILCVMGFNAKCGCFKCTVEGETEDHRTYFTDLKADLRTDESFVNLRQRPYHKMQTILTKIPRFGCVTSVPLDYMHLILLGIMRKLMYMWIGGPLTVRQGSAVVNAMSAELVQLVGWVPLEFARKTRSLQHVKRFKATEYRLILLYVGVVVFSKQLPRRLYEHFLAFHVVMTIFVDPVFCKTHLKYAKDLSIYFVETFSELYGKQYVSHNVHSMIHLHDDVERFGPVDKFSAFKFENFYQKLKKLVRKGDKPLQQIAKRYLELEKYNSVVKKSPAVEAFTVGGRYTGGVLMESCTNPQFRSCTLKGGLEVNLTEANRCCLINDSTVVLVDNFATDVNSGKTVVIGREFLKLDDVYDFPCPSSLFNILYAHQLSRRKVWLASCITRKCFRMPWKNGFIVLPMHHLP